MPLRPNTCAAVVQFLLTPLLLARGFLPALFSNVLYAAALSYYHYLSFLGYSALPFLEHTEVGCLQLQSPLISRWSDQLFDWLSEQSD